MKFRASQWVISNETGKPYRVCFHCDTSKDKFIEVAPIGDYYAKNGVYFREDPNRFRLMTTEEKKLRRALYE